MAAGQSSDVSGYSTGGLAPPATGDSNTIDKFPFATDGNATDVGDLTSSAPLFGWTIERMYLDIRRVDILQRD